MEKLIVVTELKRIETPGGDVFHAMKQSESQYEGFGEAYFSWVNEGVIKAWKMHKRMTLNLVVPVGNVRFVFVSDSENKDFRVEEIGEKRYARITVPPGVWFGFQGIGEGKNLVLNIADIEHDPEEVEKCNFLNIKYNW